MRNSRGYCRTKQRRIDDAELKKEIIEKVIKNVIPANMLRADTKYIINGTGRFVIGGTLADSGLTGRKIIVDTYGGVGSHGGGCFSGKDPSKVDRSGSIYGTLHRQEHSCRRIRWPMWNPNQLRHRSRPANQRTSQHLWHRKNADDQIMALVMKNFDMRPKAHHWPTATAKTDIPQDSGVWALRQRRRWFPLGKNRQSSNF